MFIAYTYNDHNCVLGIFTSKEKALNALVEYHGSKESAEVFGYVEEYTPDTFVLYRDGQYVHREYTSEGNSDA